jgi:hypothetical protein
MSGILTIVVAALTLIIGVLLGYLESHTSSYASEKGRNLATHEDIQKLVEQVAAVTKTTKEIEARISDDVWSRQRRWELKKEIALEALKELGSLQMAVRTVAATFAATHRMDAGSFTTAQINARAAIQAKALEAFEQATHSFGKAMLLTWVVCGQPVQNELAATEQMLVGIATKFVHDPENTGDIAEVMVRIVTKINDVARAIRNDLEIVLR